MNIREFIPPILLKLLQSLKLSSKRYKNYDEALASCKDNAYNDDDFVRVVIEKNIVFKNNLSTPKVLFDLGTLRTLIAVGLSNKGASMNIIDFGGGGGYHHTISTKALA